MVALARCPQNLPAEIILGADHSTAANVGALPCKW